MIRGFLLLILSLNIYGSHPLFEAANTSQVLTNTSYIDPTVEVPQCNQADTPNYPTKDYLDHCADPNVQSDMLLFFPPSSFGLETKKDGKLWCSYCGPYGTPEHYIKFYPADHPVHPNYPILSQGTVQDRCGGDMVANAAVGLYEAVKGTFTSIYDFGKFTVGSFNYGGHKSHYLHIFTDKLFDEKNKCTAVCEAQKLGILEMCKTTPELFSEDAEFIYKKRYRKGFCENMIDSYNKNGNLFTAEMFLRELKTDVKNKCYNGLSLIRNNSIFDFNSKLPICNSNYYVGNKILNKLIRNDVKYGGEKLYGTAKRYMAAFKCLPPTYGELALCKGAGKLAGSAVLAEFMFAKVAKGAKLGKMFRLKGLFNTKFNKISKLYTGIKDPRKANKFFKKLEDMVSKKKKSKLDNDIDRRKMDNCL
jgi:hypothetical protein